MTNHVLRWRDNTITSLNASKHGWRLPISRPDCLWRMWRRIGAWGPILETNFTFCWCTKSWAAHQCDEQFGENKSIDIGKSQRLWKEGHARINKVSAMKPGQAMVIEKVCISWYFESPEIDLRVAENACCTDHSDTLSLKRGDWLSESQSLHWGTTDYRCEDMLELNTEVARLHILIMGIHTWLAPTSKIH